MISTIRVNLLNFKKHLLSSISESSKRTQEFDEPRFLQNEAKNLLQSLIPKHFPVESHPILHDCLTVPVTGPFSPEPLSKFVVVDQRCGEAVLRGANVFAPGVLGISISASTGDKVSVLCDTTSKTKKGTKFEENSEKLEDDVSNFYQVANGVLRMDRLSIFHTVGTGIAVEIDDAVWRTSPLADAINKFPALFFLQNLPSMAVAHVLDPKSGERILDMCAAPGGKTTHIALLMQDKGEILAFDKHASKIEQVKLLQKQQQLNIINAIKEDSSQLVKKQICKQQSFDKILLDGPCSGLGQRPNFGHERVTMKELEQSASFQRRLLKEAAQLLKPGGFLVYSTCTMNPMENEENVMWFLNNYKDFELVDVPEPFQPKNFKYATPGLLNLVKDELLAAKMLNFHPSLNSESIGFFIVKFHKTG